MLQACAYSDFHVLGLGLGAEGAKTMNDVGIHQTRICTSRPAATFLITYLKDDVYYTIFPVACVPWTSCANCDKQTFDCHVNPGIHWQTVVSVHEMLLAEIIWKSSLCVFSSRRPG